MLTNELSSDSPGPAAAASARSMLRLTSFSAEKAMLLPSSSKNAATSATIGTGPGGVMERLRQKQANRGQRATVAPRGFGDAAEALGSVVGESGLKVISISGARGASVGSMALHFRVGPPRQSGCRWGMSAEALCTSPLCQPRRLTSAAAQQGWPFDDLWLRYAG